MRMATSTEPGGNTGSAPEQRWSASQFLYGVWVTGWAVLRARWYLRQADFVGPKVRVWGRPAVQNYGEMIIGDRVRLVSTVATTELVATQNGKLEIGEGVFINYGCSIAANKSIQIGSQSNIGTYVIIMDNNFHRVEPELRNVQPDSMPVVIGDNVWIGARAIILPGVEIGSGSVVGAGSVVTRDIPPRALAVGMPARVIRSL